MASQHPLSFWRRNCPDLKANNLPTPRNPFGSGINTSRCSGIKYDPLAGLVNEYAQEYAQVLVRGTLVRGMGRTTEREI